MELILDLLYIYIAIFSLYYFILAIRSLNENKLIAFRRNSADIEQDLICAIVYSHNNYEALKNILDQLVHQSYSTQNFMVYVILDNCTDHSEELLADRLNIKVLNLNDGVTVGKDQAISILLEELRQNTTISSYVFLDVHRFIEEDFLLNVNRALKLSPVVSGQTLLVQNMLITL